MTPLSPSRKAAQAEAGSIADFLAMNPTYANTTTTRQVVRELLLMHDGCLMCKGRLWDIQAKHMGVGVYRVTLKERP